jgi:DNA-binding SARP family transcriptional activator/tetratricopeptide (TPR) repeat protein
MFRLRTFGGALIEGPEGPATGAVSQRRRLAVLSLLAANSHGISRDRLVALLWPESDDERARHALSQLLYALRRELGGEAVTGGATALRLDSAVVSSDVQEFREAIASADLARADRLYAGPFLDGFHLSGCADFERWMEEERALLGQQARTAAEKLALAAEARGDAAEAVRCWQRRAALDRLDARVAAALIRAMVAAGDGAGASRQVRLYEQLVREELGVAPDPAVADALASAAAAAATRRDEANADRAHVAEAGEPGMEPRHGADTVEPPVERAENVEDLEPPRDRAVVETVEASAATTMPGPAAQSTGARRRVRRSRIALAVGALVLLVAALLPILNDWWGGSADIAPAARERVLIADVENTTGESIFDGTIPVALAVGLAQSQRLHVVSPERIRQTLVRMRLAGADTLLDEKLGREIARRDGVRFVIVPAVRRIAQRYELSARVVDPPSGGVLSLSSVTVAGQNDVIDALDRLARHLRRRLGESAFLLATRPATLPGITTHSLAALEKYAAGLRAFNHGRWAEAESLWSDAVAIDSTFATAHAARGMHAYFTNRALDGEAHFARALAHLDGLPERERTMIRIRIESWRGNRDASIALLRAFLIEHPDDLEALGRLGYDYLRTNRDSEGRDVFRRILALDSLDHSALINLATVEKSLGEFDSAIAHYRRAFALAPGTETENSNINLEFGGTYVLAGALDSAAAVFSRMLDGDRNVRARGLRSLAFLTMLRGRYAEASRHLTEAIRLNRIQQAGTSELRNRLLLATSLAQRGLTPASAAELDSAFTVALRFDADPILVFWLGKALARNGDAQRAAALLDTLDAKRHPDNAIARAAADALRGEILVARGSPATALNHFEVALRLDSSAVTLESLANAVASAGDLERATALYDELASTPIFGFEAQEDWRMAPYWLARLAERRGDTSLAARNYERFLEAWSEAEPSLPILLDARDRLVRLLAARG